MKKNDGKKSDNPIKPHIEEDDIEIIFDEKNNVDFADDGGDAYDDSDDNIDVGYVDVGDEADDYDFSDDAGNFNLSDDAGDGSVEVFTDFSDDEMHELYNDFLQSLVLKLNIKNAIKHKPAYTLISCLSLRTTTHLKKLAAKFKIKYFAKMPKHELVKLIADKYLSENYLRETLLKLDDSSWELFSYLSKVKHIQENNLNPDLYARLLRLGLIYLFYYNDNLFYTIPVEIKKIFININDEIFLENRKTVDLVTDYAIAAANLYSAISIDDFSALLNDYNNSNVSKNDIIKVMKDNVDNDYGYIIHNNYLVDDEFTTDADDIITATTTYLNEFPRYLPPLDEFLKYSNWNYIEETPQLEAVRTYFKKYLEISEDDFDEFDEFDEFNDFIYDIVHAAREMMKPQDMLKIIEDSDSFDFEVTYPQKSTLMKLLTDLCNNTRVYGYNGNTPNDLTSGGKRGIYLLPTVKDTNAIVGRNDPCPCGSGRKYKNCCGKNN